jgi:uncharacterized protein YndB with AHSA1/START domain
MHLQCSRRRQVAGEALWHRTRVRDGRGYSQRGGGTSGGSRRRVWWWGPDDGPVLIAETDVRIGGRFRVRFRMRDGSEHESSGEYLEVRSPERLAMSGRWLAGDEDTNESRLEFELRAVPGGTELTLIHSGLASEETRRSHEHGWGGALNKLVRRFQAMATTKERTPYRKVLEGRARMSSPAAKGIVSRRALVEHASTNPRAWAESSMNSPRSRRHYSPLQRGDRIKGFDFAALHMSLCGPSRRRRPAPGPTRSEDFRT